MNKLIDTGRFGPTFCQLDSKKMGESVGDNCVRVCGVFSDSTTLQLRGIAPLETEALSRGPKKLRRLYASVSLNVEQLRDVITALQEDLVRLEANAAMVAGHSQQQAIGRVLGA